MNDLSNITQTLVTTKAGLGAGTTSTYTIANLIQYAIKGKAYTKAAVTNGASPTLDGLTGVAFLPVPVGFGSVFVWGVNAAGTVVAIQGQVAALDVSGNFIYTPQFPVVPDTVAPFAYEVVRAAPATAAVPAVAPWVFGTSNQSGVTGVTIAFDDIMVLPDRPQTT